MQHTFFQKLLLTILAGFVAASLFEFYRTFVVGAMDSVNGGYKTSIHVAATPPPIRRF